jgi:hypothetical protein
MVVLEKKIDLVLLKRMIREVSGNGNCTNRVTHGVTIHRRLRSDVREIKAALVKSGHDAATSLENPR